jgi:hypothetical protein
MSIKVTTAPSMTLWIRLQGFQMFLEQNSDRVCLLTGSTAANPHPDRGPGLFSGEELRNNLGFENGEGLRIAKKLVTPIKRSRNRAWASLGDCRKWRR